jgi:hypothetical protein
MALGGHPDDADASANPPTTPGVTTIDASGQPMRRRYLVLIVLAVLVASTAAGRGLNYLFDPLRPGSLEALGVVATDTTLSFTRPIAASVARDIHDAFVQRMLRRDALARLPDDPASSATHMLIVGASWVFDPIVLVPPVMTAVWLLLRRRRVAQLLRAPT